MIKEGHVGYREALALTVVVVTAKIFTVFPQYLIRETGNAAWLEVLISTGLSVLAFFPIAALLARFPGKTSIEIVEEVLGPAIGLPANLLGIAFYLFLLGILLREFTEIVASTVLPFTPVSVITMTLLLAVGYGAYSGLETVSRAAWLLGPWLLAGMIAVFLISLRWAKLTNLLPFWGAEPPSLLASAAWRTSLFADIVILPIIAPYLRERKRFTRMGIWSIAISGLVLALSAFVYQMVFPEPASERVLFPLYQLARLMYLGRFFQRAESLFIFVWVISWTAKLAIILQGVALAQAVAMKLPLYKPLIFPLLVLSFAIAFIPADLPAAVRIEGDFLRRYAAIPTFGLLIVVYVVALIRGKGGKTHGQSKKS